MVQGITAQAIVPYYCGHDSNPSQLFANRLQEFCEEIDTLFANRSFSAEAKISLEEIKYEMLALVKEINGGTTYPENQILEFISFFSRTLSHVGGSFRQEHTHSREAPSPIRLLQYSANAHIPALPSSEDTHIARIYGVFRERINCLKTEHRAQLEFQKNSFSDQIEQATKVFEKTFVKHGKLFIELDKKISQLETAKETAETRSSNQELEIAALQGRVSVLSDEVDQREASLIETASRVGELEGQISFMRSETEANEIAHSRALETLKSDHQEQINSLKADAIAASISHHAALDELTANHQSQINNLIADAEAAGISHHAALDALTTNHQEQINTLKAEAEAAGISHHAALDALTANHQEQINTLKAEAEAAGISHHAALDALTANHQEQINTLKAEAEAADISHHAALDELTANHQEQINTLKAQAEAAGISHHAALDALTTNHQEQINTLKAEAEAAGISHHAALDELTANHQSQINNLIADAETAGKFHQTALEELTANHQEQINKLRAEAEAAGISHHAALDALTTNHQEQINKLRAEAEAAGISHNAALDALTASHQEQINTLKDEAEVADVLHQAALEELASKHQEQINTLRTDAEAAMNEVKKLQAQEQIKEANIQSKFAQKFIQKGKKLNGNQSPTKSLTDLEVRSTFLQQTSARLRSNLEDVNQQELDTLSASNKEFKTILSGHYQNYHQRASDLIDDTSAQDTVRKAKSRTTRLIKREGNIIHRIFSRVGFTADTFQEKAFETELQQVETKKHRASFFLPEQPVINRYS